MIDPNETVAEALLRYRTIIRRIQWLAAALAVEATIFTTMFGATVKEAKSTVATIFAIIVAVSLITAVGALSQSLADYDWRADLIQRLIARDHAAEKRQFNEYVVNNIDLNPSAKAKFAYGTLLISLLTSTVMLLLFPITLIYTFGSDISTDKSLSETLKRAQLEQQRQAASEVAFRKDAEFSHAAFKVLERSRRQFLS
jgi:hypothetical protein